MAEVIPSNATSVQAQMEYYNTRPNCDGQNPQYASDFDFHQMVLKWKAQAEADQTCACPQTIEIIWESAPNFSFQAHCTNGNGTYGPYNGTFSQHFVCQSGDLINGSCITYSCPSTGTWTLSADKQACSGCWDPSKVPSADGTCVSVEDKELGPNCSSQLNNYNPSLRFIL